MNESFRVDMLVKGVVHWQRVADQDTADGYADGAEWARGVVTGLATEAAGIILGSFFE